jgi:hypothetical protein
MATNAQKPPSITVPEPNRTDWRGFNFCSPSNRPSQLTRKKKKPGNPLCCCCCFAFLVFSLLEQWGLRFVHYNIYRYCITDLRVPCKNMYLLSTRFGKQMA